MVMHNRRRIVSDVFLSLMLIVGNDEGPVLQQKSPLTFRVDPRRPKYYVIVDDTYP
jgi:hypothetical protein